MNNNQRGFSIKKTAIAILMMVAVFTVLSAATSSNILPDREDNLEQLEYRKSISIRDVIRQQIEAFKRNEISAAFDLATPEIQDQFGTSDIFFQMVIKNYAVILTHKTWNFGNLTKIRNEEYIQTVNFYEKDGRVLKALYVMEQQPEGTWRIGGCKLILDFELAT